MDGTVDDTTTVVWLQLESRMADVRVGADIAEIAYRGSLSECSILDLKRLALSDSSSGYTACTAVESTPDGRRATAEWFTPEPGSIYHGVAFQPVSAYPEPGLLWWPTDDDDLLIEQAPSGAYTEEWRRLPESAGALSHEVLDDGRELYRAGSLAVLVRDRAVAPPRKAPLAELIAELSGSDDEIRRALIDLVDCEFSVAERRDDELIVTASTLPWRIGHPLLS